MAAEKAVKVLEDISVDAKNDKMLRIVADTSLTGKAVGENSDKEHLSELIVKAAKSVADEKGKVDTKDIRISKKVGGVISDTYLVQGVVIDKELVHSRMPKRMEKAKIALFNCPLEVKKTEIDAQIQITDPARMNDFLAEEEASMKRMVDAIVATGANVVFCTKGVDELVQHYLAKAGIMGYRRLKESDLEAIAKATGATISGNPLEITKKELGSAGCVEERLVGEDGM